MTLGPFKYKAQEISSTDLDIEEEDVQEDEDKAEVGIQPKPVFMCVVFSYITYQMFSFTPRKAALKCGLEILTSTAQLC